MKLKAVVFVLTLAPQLVRKSDGKSALARRSFSIANAHWSPSKAPIHINESLKDELSLI